MKTKIFTNDEEALSDIMKEHIRYLEKLCKENKCDKCPYKKECK